MKKGTRTNELLAVKQTNAVPWSAKMNFDVPKAAKGSAPGGKDDTAAAADGGDGGEDRGEEAAVEKPVLVPFAAQFAVAPLFGLVRSLRFEGFLLEIFEIPSVPTSVSQQDGEEKEEDAQDAAAAAVSAAAAEGKVSDAETKIDAGEEEGEGKVSEGQEEGKVQDSLEPLLVARCVLPCPSFASAMAEAKVVEERQCTLEWQAGDAKVTAAVRLLLNPLDGEGETPINRGDQDVDAAEDGKAAEAKGKAKGKGKGKSKGKAKKGKKR